MFTAFFPIITVSNNYFPEALKDTTNNVPKASPGTTNNNNTVKTFHKATGGLPLPASPTTASHIGIPLPTAMPPPLASSPSKMRDPHRNTMTNPHRDTTTPTNLSTSNNRPADFLPPTHTNSRKAISCQRSRTMSSLRDVARPLQFTAPRVGWRWIMCRMGSWEAARRVKVELEIC